MNYKKGDTVIIKSDLVVDKVYGSDSFSKDMEQYKGKVTKIKTVDNDFNFYHLDIDKEGFRFHWTDTMLDLVTNDSLNEKIKNITKSKKIKGGSKKLYFSKNTFKVLDKAVESNYPVLLVGDTGTGKTTIIRELAKGRKKELIRLNLTGQTGVDEILGKWLASPTEGTYWLDGLLITAMRKGYWIVLDEINMALPEILSALHSLLDDDRKVVLKEKDGEIVHCHKHFRIFATMNPSDEYVGTKDLNKAFLSRFPIVLDINYSDKENRIIKEESDADDENINKLVLIGKEMRNSKEKNLITYTCSTRDLVYTACLIKEGLDIGTALNVAVINKAPKEERKAIAKVIEIITNTNIKIEEFSSETYTSIIDLLEEMKSKLSSHKNIVKDYKDKIELLKQNKKEDVKRIENYQKKVRDFNKTITGFKASIKNEKTKTTKLEKKLITKEKLLELATENIKINKK